MGYTAEFPATEQMRFARALMAAQDDWPPMLGRGTPTDPLFPVKVELPDNHAVAIIGAVRREASRYISRHVPTDAAYRKPLADAILGELTSGTYEDLIYRAACLVDLT